MSKVAKIEPPVTTGSYLVWIVKEDDEQWSTVRDDSYREQSFVPNRAVVVVDEHNGRFDSNWIQVRDHYYGDPTEPDREMCRGTHLFKGSIVDYMPVWAYEARDLAVREVQNEG